MLDRPGGSLRDLRPARHPAFEWFGKAIDARDPIATHLPFMPLYDGLRKAPRFSGLLAKMNLE